MKEIEQVLIQLSILNEVGNYEAGRQPLPIGSNRISLPRVALASNEEHPTKDVEAQSVHVRSNE